MIKLQDLDMFTLGEQAFDLQSFDCGRPTVNHHYIEKWLRQEDCG